MSHLRERLQAVLGDAYVVERELGGGGMSRVFVALDRELGRRVVVKVLPPERAAHVDVGRFRREIHLAASLQHPHIVPLLTAHRADDLVYYTMPLIEGESLRARLDRLGALPIEDVLRILRDIVDAIAYAHTRGVVHRDIKPDNVLVSGEHALVTDFGIAKALSAAGDAPAVTTQAVAVGTPAYMAPEQATADPQADHRADIYAVGVLAYEMLSGQPPFVGATTQEVLAAQVLEPPVHLSHLQPSLQPALAQLVMRCLEKNPGDRWQTGQELLAQLEALAMRGGAFGTWAPLYALPPRARQALMVIAGVTVVAVAALVRFSRSSVRIALDPDLVAVAPFDVLVPNQQLWREGLVDVLSRNLDGVGSLRTVSPTLVVRRWKGHADPDAAVQLGRRTGAGLVVFGQMVGAGPDSVRLSAVILDAATKRSLGEIEVRQESARMDRLADSLALGLLRELARTRPTGTTRLTSFSEASLPALKAFLQGRQFYRRAVWDSALLYYDRALELDSTFALALRGVRQVTWWASSVSRPDSRDYALRAGAHNRGLAPRESLLVVADSLLAALDAGPLADSAWLSHERRVFATLEDARTRYPDDPEVWYQQGETRFHFGWYMGIPAQRALEAFDEAIALDSGFAPAYFHSIELALTHRGTAEGMRYARRYVALHATSAAAQGIDVVAKLLDPATSSAAADPLLDAVSVDALRDIYQTVRRWPDSAETATRAVAAAKRRARTADDSVALLPYEAQALSYRGHLHQAAVVGFGAPKIFATLALLGAFPNDSAARTFARWPREWRAFALPFWAARADTASIGAVGRWAESVARSGGEGGRRVVARYVAATARAYLALARHDTTQAMRVFERLPDMICQRPFWGVPISCLPVLLTRAQLLKARGRDREAAKILDAGFPESTDPLEPMWVLERGRLSERLGDREKALGDYRFVAEVWQHADPGLLPYVAEARAALKRLGAER